MLYIHKKKPFGESVTLMCMLLLSTVMIDEKKQLNFSTFACFPRFSHSFSFFWRRFTYTALSLDSVSGPSQDCLHCVSSVARWVLMIFARLSTERRV